MEHRQQLIKTHQKSFLTCQNIGNIKNISALCKEKLTVYTGKTIIT